MLKYKPCIKIIFIVVLLCHFFIAKSQENDEKDKLIIKGELDPKTSNIIKNKLEELHEENEKIKADILLLQDKLISKNKDNIDIKIYISTDTETDLPHYGIIQLTGAMNNIPVIHYDHPLIFEKKSSFPLFDGMLPLGKYEFKIRAIVGQQLEKWPFILPEGKWSIEKTLKINANLAGEKKDFEIALISDKKTGIPQFELKNEED